MTVLNTIELTEQSLLPFIITAGSWLSLCISIPLCQKVKNQFLSFIFFFYSIIALATGIAFLFAASSFQEPSGKYQYEITIEDDTSFAEVIEKYNVVEQRGEIFVVEEKNDESVSE